MTPACDCVDGADSSLLFSDIHANHGGRTNRRGYSVAPARRCRRKVRPGIQL